MARCDLCGEEMREVSGCSANRVIKYPDGSKLSSVPFIGEESSKRCHDCNVEFGGYHHPGCDREKCPRCGGQLISCGCLDEKE